MIKCRYHAERDARLLCNKHEYGYCEDCCEGVVCGDPELYCRHRTQCLIWENSRETLKRRRRHAESV
jgi:hypothetical protein